MEGDGVYIYRHTGLFTHTHTLVIKKLFWLFQKGHVALSFSFIFFSLFLTHIGKLGSKALKGKSVILILFLLTLA